MSRLCSPPSTSLSETSEASPSLSAAEALAATPFFCELSAVDLARLVPDLEEHTLVPGTVVFRQGDPGDGFYLIRAGAVDVTVTATGGEQIVTRLEAPAPFGETALLTGEQRSATAVAATPLVLWKLPRERFDTLLQDHPRVALRIAADLSTRLTEATRQLSTTRQQIGTVARAAYSALDPAAQALLRRTAIFGRFDVELLRASLGQDWSQVPFERLVEEEVFFRPMEPSGWFGFLQDSVRAFLLRQLRIELGERGLHDLRRRAADELLARQDVDPGDAMDLLLEAKDWNRLARLLEDRGASQIDQRAVRLEAYLRALPAKVLWTRPSLVHLLGESRATQGKLEQAIEIYREAERRVSAFRRPPLSSTLALQAT